MNNSLTITITKEEATNILHGLDLLQTKVKKNISDITPITKGADDLRAYFKEKEAQVKEQIIIFNNFLTS
jgi:hypothetical protein